MKLRINRRDCQRIVMSVSQLVMNVLETVLFFRRDGVRESCLWGFF
jgi:hypothetical protein